MFFLQSYPQETNPDKAVEKKKTARPNRGQGLDKVEKKGPTAKDKARTRRRGQAWTNRPGQGLKQNTQTFTKPRQRPSRTKAWTAAKQHTQAHIYTGTTPGRGGEGAHGPDKQDTRPRGSRGAPRFFPKTSRENPNGKLPGRKWKITIHGFIDHSGWVAPVESYPCACGILRNKNKADSIVNPANICLMHDGSTV